MGKRPTLGLLPPPHPLDIGPPTTSEVQGGGQMIANGRNSPCNYGWCRLLTRPRSSTRDGTPRLHSFLGYSKSPWPGPQQGSAAAMDSYASKE
eukprot:3977021-Pyramimonas_sp.AAC.1